MKLLKEFFKRKDERKERLEVMGKINRRLDDLEATINGEEKWFLKMEKAEPDTFERKLNRTERRIIEKVEKVCGTPT